MITDKVLKVDEIQLRSLTMKDASVKYLRWLHDRKITKYLGGVHTYHKNINELKNSIVAFNKSADSILFGIFLLEDNHIGNIKLGFINKIHKFAEIGLIIGERKYWGRGYATRAIHLVSGFAIENLGLVRLTAHCVETNRGSINAFSKAGFRHEGTLRNYWNLEGQRFGNIIMGQTVNDRIKYNRKYKTTT